MSEVRMLLTFVEKVFGGFSHYYYGRGEKIITYIIL